MLLLVAIWDCVPSESEVLGYQVGTAMSQFKGNVEVGIMKDGMFVWGF